MTREHGSCCEDCGHFRCRGCSRLVLSLSIDTNGTKHDHSISSIGDGISERSDRTNPAE